LQSGLQKLKTKFFKKENAKMFFQALLLLVLGYTSGMCSGLIGIGGGSLITPALIYLFGFNQHLAQGTTLMLLVPPIGLMSALTYYQQGYVNIKAGLLICLGFFVGSLLGANLAIGLPGTLLKKAFGVITIAIGLKMTFDK
jgi:uncharacterized protein